MKNNQQHNETPKFKELVIKMAKDKASINKHIRQGGSLKDLKSQGFRFAKPI